MLDVIIRGGQVVDGTGSPRRKADVGIKGDRVVRIGEITEEGAAEVRRHRQGRDARIRRRAHPLRCPGVLGRGPHPVTAARGDHRPGRQLRIHDRAVVGRPRRRRLPDADARPGRRHAPRVSSGRRPVELEDHRRVPRRHRGPARHQRRFHGRPFGHPANRHEGRFGQAGGQPRRARSHEALAAGRPRCGRPRASPRRGPGPTTMPMATWCRRATPAGTRSSSCAG